MRMARCTRIEPMVNMSRPTVLRNAFIDLKCAAEKSSRGSSINLERYDKTCFHQEVRSR